VKKQFTLNTEKITALFCQGKTLVFYPKTEEDSIFIQNQLFAMGYQWNDSSRCITAVRESIDCGIYLKNNVIRYNTANASEGGLLCNSSQFAKNYTSPDRAFMLEMFNKMAAQITALSEEVASLRKDLQPAKLDKPVFKKPDSAP
jgi:hypothetical protein